MKSKKNKRIARAARRQGLGGRRLYLLKAQMGARRLLARLGLALPDPVHYIGGSDTLPPPLPPEDERSAIERLCSGDEEAI